MKIPTVRSQEQLGMQFHKVWPQTTGEWRRESPRGPHLGRIASWIATRGSTNRARASLLFLGSRRREDAAQDFVVAFVARVFVQPGIVLLQPDDCRPRRRPRR